MLGSVLARACFRNVNLHRTFIHTSTSSLGSALYVTGQRANETFAYLLPYLDCDDKFNNIEELRHNVHVRGLDVDVEKLKASWDFLNSVKETKHQLELQRIQTTNKIQSLAKEKSEQTESEINSLKTLGKMLRENLKTITKEIWDLEEVVMVKILSLPNDLHSDTPIDEETVVEVSGEPPKLEPSPSNLEIGEKLGVLKFVNPYHYYLEGPAAQFEIGLVQYVSYVLNQNDFLQTSNADFCKSLLVEGCGLNHTDPSSVFILQSSEGVTNQDQALHLVGGASMPSFCALFTKSEMLLSGSPLKLCAQGRFYTPPPLEFVQKNLFQVAQETAIDVFLACDCSQDELMKSYLRTLSLIDDIYKNLGFHFRFVKCTPPNLLLSESLKTSIQMYSRHQQCYVEVGHLSIIGDYVSKRLLMKYSQPGRSRGFLKVISGRVLSVPRILGCLLEEHGNISVPGVLKDYVY